MRYQEFAESSMCPECGGASFSDLMLAEKQDACYHKVKSRYKVWPSAYASGALVQCRKKGAANWGNKSKNESMAEGASNIGAQIRAAYQKIYNAGDDAVEFAYYDSPIFAQYWDEYEGDLDSIIAEVDPTELQVILDELTSAAEDQGVAEGLGKDMATLGGIATLGIAGGLAGNYADQQQPKVEVGGKIAFVEPAHSRVPDTAMTLTGKDGKTYRVWATRGTAQSPHRYHAVPVQDVKEGGENWIKLPNGNYRNTHTGVVASKPPTKKKRSEKTGAEWDAINAKKQQGVAEANPNQQLALYKPDSKTYRGQPVPGPDTVDPNDITARRRRADSFSHRDVDKSQTAHDPEQTAHQEQLKRMFDRMLQDLPPRMKQFVYLRYHHDMTLDQVAQRLGIATETARQIEAKMLRKLKGKHGDELRKATGATEPAPTAVQITNKDAYAQGQADAQRGVRYNSEKFLPRDKESYRLGYLAGYKK